MVLPRAREKRSLTKFLTTLCAVNALFLALPKCNAEPQLATGNALRTTRKLDAQLFVESTDGSPATWVDDDDPTRPSLNAISITSTEAVIPIYGPDVFELPFQTLGDVEQPTTADTAPPVVAEEPMVMSPIPVDDNDSLVDTLPTDQVPFSAPPPSPATVLVPSVTLAPTAPATDTPTTTDDASNGTMIVITLPDEEPITVTIPDSADPTPAPTDTLDWAPNGPTPAPTDTGSEPAVVVVFTPSTDDLAPTAATVDDIPTAAPTATVIDDGATPVVSPATGDNGGEQTFEPMGIIFDDGTPTAAPTVPVASGETLDAGGDGEQTSEPMSIIFDDEIVTPAPTTPVAPGSDVSPYLFATKTAYWDERDLYPDDNLVQLTKRMAEMQLNELTLLQVQQVNRHGARSVIAFH